MPYPALIIAAWQAIVLNLGKINVQSWVSYHCSQSSLDQSFPRSVLECADLVKAAL
jgi:hypothetical protein